MKLYYDFHIHSGLSPCGDNEMTPNNIVNMAKLYDLDVIALTDHNSTLNCKAVMEAAEEIGLLVIPGMELCTSEEVHIVCLFPNLESATKFGDYIRSTLPPIRNKPTVFGEQLVFDKNDNVLGFEHTLLITASSISANDAVSVVADYGGICFPAHIDRNSYSILSNLGTIDESFRFNCAEVFDTEQIEQLKIQHPYLNNLRILSSSDAHYLEHLRLKEHFIEPAENTIEAIFEYLKSPC
ncbi:MAG: PHP domain-containing protein [Ruminococcaceae bacterium]|nr:PHP domain-containing protein [Oscillospiraceae bacterium]